MKVIKNNGTLEKYTEQKIINAVSLAAQRALFNLTSEDYALICNRVLEIIDEEGYFEDRPTEIWTTYSIIWQENWHKNHGEAVFLYL